MRRLIGYLLSGLSSLRLRSGHAFGNSSVDVFVRGFVHGIHSQINIFQISQNKS